MSTHDEVLKAAADLVAAFSSHNTNAYFAAFDENASFVFHNLDRRLLSRGEYEAVWAEWEQDGFKVLGCQSSAQHVQIISDNVAVFTHTVRTQLADGDGSIESGERETIVFHRVNDAWLGIHEHLSVDPTYA